MEHKIETRAADKDSNPSETRQAQYEAITRLQGRVAELEAAASRVPSAPGGLPTAMEGGERLYNALALFDTRDGSALGAIVQSAREGWERSHPDMAEEGAWAEFDARIDRYETPGDLHKRLVAAYAASRVPDEAALHLHATIMPLRELQSAAARAMMSGGLPVDETATLPAKLVKDLVNAAIEAYAASRVPSAPGICGVVCACGPNGEPLACGYES